MKLKLSVLKWPKKRTINFYCFLLNINRAEKADLLLVLLDEAAPSNFLKENSELLKIEKTIFVQSMADLDRETISIDHEVLKVSSVTGEGISSLVSAIEQKLLQV